VVFSSRSRQTLTQKFIVIPVLADPKPQYAIGDFDPQCPVMESDTDGSICFYFFEMEGRMMGIFFQKSKVPVSQILYGIWESIKTGPKIRRGNMLQSSRLSPRLCPDSAFAANFSSLPASISDSI